MTESFTEKELQVLKTFEKVIPKLSKMGKEQLLSFGEGLTANVEAQIKKLEEEQRVQSERTALKDPVRTSPGELKVRQMVYNLPVETAAELMGVSLDFVYNGLRDGVLPFGWAVKNSSIWTYYISSAKFTEYTGIQVPQL